jgi:GntR family transcriptional repressor for pyruvate dehydrogenase complex
MVRESLITRTAEELRRWIRAEQLTPGAPLPPETHLARMLGISRNSLREALRILDGLGFVEKQPGRRVVVRAATPTPTRSFDRRVLADAVPALHQARLAIEQRAATLATAHATDAEIAEIDSHLARFTEALKRGDGAAAGDAHDSFHAAVVTAAHNPILFSLFTEVCARLAGMSTEGRQTLKERRQGPLHGAIVQAIRARDGRRAAAAVRRHFHTVAPLLEFISKDRRGDA